jgi:hypothetical protein
MFPMPLESIQMLLRIPFYSVNLHHALLNPTNSPMNFGHCQYSRRASARLTAERQRPPPNGSEDINKRKVTQCAPPD